MNPILIPVAPGELIDKITILEIKSARIQDPCKRAHVETECALLQTVYSQRIPPSAELSALIAELKTINEAMWEIEDAIRDCERAGDFGPRFIDLARSVYKTNDQRARLKRQINELLGSEIVE